MSDKRKRYLLFGIVVVLVAVILGAIVFTGAEDKGPTSEFTVEVKMSRTDQPRRAEVTCPSEQAPNRTACAVAEELVRGTGGAAFVQRDLGSPKHGFCAVLAKRNRPWTGAISGRILDLKIKHLRLAFDNSCTAGQWALLTPILRAAAPELPQLPEADMPNRYPGQGIITPGAKAKIGPPR